MMVDIIVGPPGLEQFHFLKRIQLRELRFDAQCGDDAALFLPPPETPDRRSTAEDFSARARFSASNLARISLSLRSAGQPQIRAWVGPSSPDNRRAMCCGQGRRRLRIRQA
jgi:hypothetical protein